MNTKKFSTQVPMNITLGFICGESGSVEMLTKISLYSVFMKIDKDLNFKVTRVLIIDQSDNQSVIRTAISLFGKKRVTKVNPSPWQDLGLPPMANGSFATYYKFDIFKASKPEELVLYLDSDTVINKVINPSLVEKLIKNESTVLLMVPSPRSVIERLGYMENINPYAYFNAGVIFYKSNKPLNFKDLMLHVRQYINSGLDLSWHDQDLINTYYSKYIKPLPLEYNVSTGMLRKELYSESNLNYIIQKRLSTPYILHASGGVLFKPKLIYPFRIFFYEQFNEMWRNLPVLTDQEFKEMEAFKRLLLLYRKFPTSLVNRIRMFSGLTQECHPNYYRVYYYKHMLKKILIKFGAAKILI